MISVKYISLGCGVQSTALLALVKRGELEATKGIVFADTGDEPKWVYDTLDKLKSHFKIYVCKSKHGSLSDFTLKRQFISAPVYMQKSDGTKYFRSIGQRQCTTMFKIQPIFKQIRLIEGKVGKRLAERSISVAIGISTDESLRAKPSRTRWIENVYPLLKLGLNRADCKRLCMDVFGFVPHKSSCTFCPYKSKKDFKFLKDNDPAGWKKACDFDNKIRSFKDGIINHCYREHVALDKIDFTDIENQFNLFSDMCEEGSCGL